ncbi:hypothetical protein [Vreelandella titanicae]
MSWHSMDWIIYVAGASRAEAPSHNTGATALMLCLGLWEAPFV